jgi:hypothetical protein
MRDGKQAIPDEIAKPIVTLITNRGVMAASPWITFS